jgi:hypothetical protein
MNIRTELLNTHVSRYFHQAATLRLCLQFNLDDYQFSQNGGRIIYLIDSNIFRFFLNPHKEIGHVAAFGPTRTAREDFGPATAALTAEFLFSRRLAGQQDNPTYIAPSHGEDVLDVIQGLRNTEDFIGEPLSEAPESTFAKVDYLLEQLTLGVLQPEAAKAELRRLVPPSASRFFLEGPFSEATQLQRLHEEDLLRPLALHPAATRRILELDSVARGEIRNWVSLLLVERPATSPGIRKKIERDAEALVQIMLLDEEENVEGSIVRYVMITADHNLFDAYTKWFWQLNKSPNNRPVDKQRFVLRMPLQYVPLLNVLEMPNGIESSDIMQRARIALDSLFVNLRRVDPGYPHTLSLYRILARLSVDFHNSLRDLYGFDPITFGEESVNLFRQIRRDWDDMYRNCVILNAELLERRTEANLVRLARLLRTDADLRTSIYEDQQRILDQVAARHLSVGNKINMATIAGLDKSEAPLLPRRAPLVIRASFPRILGAESLDRALDRLAQKDRPLIRSVETALNSVLDSESFFFAACVAHRCGAWWASWYFARRALDIVESTVALRKEWCEIAYIFVSASRYALPSREGIEDALDVVTQMEAYCRKNSDQFGLGRTLCEKTSLLLIVLYASHLLPSPITNALREKVEGLLPQFRSNITEASEVLKAAQRQNKELAASAETLQMQLSANVVSADVFIRVLQGSTFKNDLLPSSTEIDNVLATARENSEFNPPILDAERLMVRYVRGMVSREAARSELSSILEAVRGVGYQLDLDRAEFDRFEEILAKKKGRHARSKLAAALLETPESVL